MGKTWNRLQNQLKTEHKKDAEDCIIIYNTLKEMSGGHVWESNWNPLVYVEWIGMYPNNKWIYKPSNLGRIFLEGLKQQK